MEFVIGIVSSIVTKAAEYTISPIINVEFSSHARHAKVAMQGEVAASSRAMKYRNWSLKLPNYLLCFDCIFNYYFVI
ncbi:hypothetical protein ES332_A10G294700v1 [Gossypium tomentosum]|uniref:Uncharacterized protein n=1 Tax=Gossypium tomentosum TaxID=34277 RepID=A0A5D2NZ61_GOSTO|nr:hypothetical protein ES332_A10G294700v1 [Gossypium tomentosum]